MKHEPAMTAGFVIALVAGILSMLRAFGVKLGQEQIDALLNLAGLVAPILLPVLGGLWVRARVTPVSKLEAEQ